MNPPGKRKIIVWLIVFALAGTVVAGPGAFQVGSHMHPASVPSPVEDTRIQTGQEARSYYLCDCDITNYWCRHCCRIPGDAYCPHGGACVLFGICYPVK
jgi:hypothetical protein